LVARLVQECEVIVAISHAHVVRLYASGVCHERVWLLLDLVDGPDLGRLARDAGGFLPVERAVGIVRQACEGVAAAHARQIIHRDLGPGNILVAADDLVKVADFGSAKLKSWGVKTTNEQDVASMLYMAPEYAKGHAEPRSDVYAMGVVLYEILTGAHPVVPYPATPIDIVERHVLYEPPPLAALGRGFPSDLSDLVQKAMSKDPAGRPSMRVLAERLAEVHHRLLAPRRAEVLRGLVPGRDKRLHTTVPMSAVHAPQVPPPGEDRAALPPPAPPPALDRRPARPAAIPRTVPLERFAPHPAAPSLPPERPSTTVPVARATPTMRSASLDPKPRARALRAWLAGVGALLLFGLAAAWWVFLGPSGAPASASSGPPPAPSAAVPSASASAQHPKAPPAPPRRHGGSARERRPPE
jgi:serine/threonine-protein kinase